MIIVRESNQRIVWNFKIVNFCFKNYFPLRKGNQIPYFLAVLFVIENCFLKFWLTVSHHDFCARTNEIVGT
jgi:hypothetical protein